MIPKPAPELPGDFADLRLLSLALHPDEAAILAMVLLLFLCLSSRLLWLSVDAVR